MANELVTFGRVPKNQIPTTKTPGKLWVTNDTENNPDNLSEAFVDDTSSRRLQITDRELRTRVSELETESENTNPISDDEIEEIVRSAGGNPASPLNFKNNIMFSSLSAEASVENNPKTITFTPTEYGAEGIPNLDTPYTILLICNYFPLSSVYGSYTEIEYKLHIFNTDIAINASKFHGAQIDLANSKYCIPYGTYMFRISVNDLIDVDDPIDVDDVYIIPGKNTQVSEDGNVLFNQNGSVIGFTQQSSPEVKTLAGDSTEFIAYMGVDNGAYIIVQTSTNRPAPSSYPWTNITPPSDPSEVSEDWKNIQSFITNYISNYSLSNSVTLNPISSSWIKESGTFSDVSPNATLTIFGTTVGNNPRFRATLNLPGNQNHNRKKLVFFLPTISDPVDRQT